MVDAIPGGAPAIPIIDTHVHVWRLTDPWMSWLADRPLNWDPVRRDFSWTDLRDQLDKAGVGRLILVQAATSVEESQRLLRLAEREPSVAGVVGWVTLSDPLATETALAALGGSSTLVGIRALHDWQPDGDVLARPQALASCQMIAERGLSLDVFINHHSELALIESLAGQMPADFKIVINHLGRPPIGVDHEFQEWAALMSDLSALPNVYVKYSGWATFVQRVLAADVAPYISFVVEHFGASRVMYASNWPVALVAGGYQTTLDATRLAIGDLSVEEQRQVFAKTAEEFYLTR